ncbi:response regulator [Actinoplanes sp. NPDC051475]|uniref:response regulator transcription factor n=1 Tax=Actinoplanes sp. NPDC051475 TaxID=3157225 RepID=UPI00344BF46D
MARLLVVDDEPDICALVARHLIRAGHQVICAHDAPTALAEIAVHGVPDAAVLDVGMPGMDGFALLERLRAGIPGLPTVFLTVLWDADVLAAAARYGAGYVAKPFTPSALHDALHDVLTRAREAPRHPGTAS